MLWGRVVHNDAQQDIYRRRLSSSILVYMQHVAHIVVICIWNHLSHHYTSRILLVYIWEV